MARLAVTVAAALALLALAARPATAAGEAGLGHPRASGTVARAGGASACS